MNSEPTLCDTELEGLLDRLVCGDLDETARGRVLAWLEQDPRRWRLCGLAFLEAQTWSQTLSQMQQGEGRERVVPAKEPSNTRSAGRLVRWCAALAACLVISFGLGFSLHDAMVTRIAPSAAGANEPSERPLPQPREGTPVLASLTLESSSGLPAASQVQFPVVPRKETEPPAEEIPEYVRRQWERQGYQLSVERRFLFAKLTNGQQVVVPVEQVLFSHVPPKVY